MPVKPHRVLIGQISGFAEEAAAFMRRRRKTRKPFARVHYPGGRSASYPPETDEGRALFLAASKLIDAAGR
jgi:hypothetical protein